MVLTRYFHTNVLKYDTEKDSEDLIGSMYASFLLPYIGTPSGITPHSKTLIDNVFSNKIKDGSISGNIATTIYDCYAPFLLLQNLIIKIQQTVKYITQDFKKLNKNNLERVLVNTNCDGILEISNGR